MRMTIRRIAVPTAVLLLALLAGVAGADLGVQEAPLMPGGQVYEVTRGPTGLLYLSDTGSQEIWRVDPISGNYTVYQGVYGQDATAAADAAIWFTDGAEVFGRINPQTGVKTTWAAGLAGEVNLWGTAAGPNNTVWLSEWFGSGSRLFRFTPGANELCSVTPVGGVSSYYVLVDDNEIWLGNWAADKIMRFTVSGNQLQLRAWDLPAGSNPVGMALDGDGNLWWADAPAGVPLRRPLQREFQPETPATAGTLARLEPGANRLTRYTLPAGSNPQWVAVDGSFVWYTEITGRTVGKLAPELASGTPSTLTFDDEMLTLSCLPLGTGAPSAVSTRTGTLAFTAGSWSAIVTSGGWSVYQMPAGAAPYGLAASADSLWIGDQGRQQLAKVVEAACYPYDVHPAPPACDGDVDIADIQTAAGCFNQPFSATCPAALNFNGVGLVDVGDVTLVAQQWGWTQ
jgi:streptogramin lyase